MCDHQIVCVNCFSGSTKCLLLHCVYFVLNNIKKATPKFVFSLQLYLMLLDLKVKVKFTLEQTTKAKRGSRGIAVLFL